MSSAVIKNLVRSVMQKAANSYTDTAPTKVPGIKGDSSGASLTPMAAGTKQSPGPVSTNEGRTKASTYPGCKHKKAPRVSGTGKVKRSGLAADPSTLPIRLAEKRAFGSAGGMNLSGQPAAASTPTPKPPAAPKPNLSGMTPSGGGPKPGLGMSSTGSLTPPSISPPDPRLYSKAGPPTPTEGVMSLIAGGKMDTPVNVNYGDNRFQSDFTQQRLLDKNVERWGPEAVQNRTQHAIRRRPNRPIMTKQYSDMNFAEKLAMAKIGPVTKAVPLREERDKERAQQALRQSLV